MYDICSCYRTVPSGLWEIQQFISRGKYLPTLREVTCDNCFIVKCLLISNGKSFFTY